MLDHHSDGAIAVAIGRYQREALEEAFRRHGSAVLALAERVLRRRDLAEEVVQDVFLRLWTTPQRFDPSRGSLRTFLLTQTHSRSVDLLRSEGARKRREERRIDGTPSTDPSDEAVSRLEGAAVRRALATLPEEERRCIELAYFGGHSYRQVATLLDAPEGSVKTRIRNGMRRLRDALDTGTAAT